ncbi:MAG: DUF4190 domain-containing protein [Planctomycetota bacterium]
MPSEPELVHHPSEAPPQVDAPKPGPNVIGIISIIVGVLALLCTCGVFSPLGLLLGFVGWFFEPKGTAIAGMVLGAIGTVVLVIAIMSKVLETATELGNRREEAEVAAATAKSAEETRLTITKIAKEFRAAHESPDTLPKTFASQDLDAWGRVIQYQSSPRGFSLRSAGPDARLGTADDVRVQELYWK